MKPVKDTKPSMSGETKGGYVYSGITYSDANTTYSQPSQQYVGTPSQFGMFIRFGNIVDIKPKA